ncbi:hypothetical protein DMH18_11985 [Streptomyces sp. WAC 06783]|nr:hypothetical protein DMH18_11985 [Streptomyces sp. WAC 06783]
MLPGITLVGLGIVLPLIPMLSMHAEAVRWTLVIFGVTSTLSASSEVSGRVSDVLGKAIPFK